MQFSDFIIFKNNRLMKGKYGSKPEEQSDKANNSKSKGKNSRS